MSSCGGAEEQHAAGVAADVEVAGDDEAVAGVVAFAAEDDDGAVDAEALEHIDATAAGVFHEDEAGDAELVDRDAIDGAGLLAVEDGRGHAARVTWCGRMATRSRKRKRGAGIAWR